MKNSENFPFNLAREYYAPSNSYEYFDGENFYSRCGGLLRNPNEFDDSAEGYTPFGDE